MTDFIREVDEDLRQDRVKQALNRYWYVLVAAVVLVLGGVAAWKGYEYVAGQKAETASAGYLAALDLDRDGKTDEAKAALQKVEAAGTPGYQLLARFRLAGLTAGKDPAAGAKAFDALAADAAVPTSMQQVAKLRAGLLLVDQLPYPELKQRLAPLADANSAVRNPAREMLALAALKAGQIDDARRNLDDIESDPTTGASLRQRVDALQGLVTGAGEAPTPTSAPITPSAPTAPSATEAPSAPAAAPTAATPDAGSSPAK